MIDLAESGLPKGINVDTSRIASIGFSLGGYTALATAGAQISKADYISYCEDYYGTMDCAWFNNANINFNTIDTDRYEQSHRDPRITTVVAIDPAAAQAYQPSSLTTLDLPVQIINLGAAGGIPAAVDGEPIAAHLPNVRLDFVDQATHFSFLGECTSKGWLFIEMAGEDPICSEIGTRAHADIHQELTAKISGFFQNTLLNVQDGS